MSLSGAPGLGDAARLLAGLRQSTDLKARLARLGQELSSGKVADPVARMGGDTRPLADLDRRVALAAAWAGAARGAAGRLASMQAALDGVDSSRTSLVARLTTTGADPAATSAQAREAFADMTARLNATLGGASLLAGTREDGPALAPAPDMMASMGAALAGAATAAEVATRLDAWFDDPSGGFFAMGYLGAPRDATRPIGEGEAVALGARADDPAIRTALKGAALAAFATDPALALPEGEADALLARARDALLDAKPLADLHATLGAAEARAEAAADRHDALGAAWAIRRKTLTEADPFATATALQAAQTQLDTHYEVTARLASLTLLSHLR